LHDNFLNLIADEEENREQLFYNNCFEIDEDDEKKNSNLLIMK